MAVRIINFYGAYKAYSSCPIEAITYLDASGITDIAIRNNYCQFVQELKDNGVYSLIDVLYPDLGSNASQNELNAINPVDSDGAFRRTFSGGVTFDPVTGTKGNGTNGYYDTKYIPYDNNTLATGIGVVWGIHEDFLSTGIDFGVTTSEGYGLVGNSRNTSNNSASRVLSTTLVSVANTTPISEGVFSVWRVPYLTESSIRSKGNESSSPSSFYNQPLGSLTGLSARYSGIAQYFSPRAQIGFILFKNATRADVLKIETALQNMNARR